MDSQASSSFHQRRKRSESTGGLKNTAGTFTRIVKKGSSSFLRKFVKNFDDKDAPPMPGTSTPTSSTISSPPPTIAIATRASTAPELPTLSSPIRGQERIGPLDTPPPLSPLLSQEIASHFSNIESPLPHHSSADSQKQYRRHQQQTSNVESWLKDAAAANRLEEEEDEEEVAFSPSDLAARMAILSQDPVLSLHRQLSRGADSNTGENLADIERTLHSDDEDEDEDVDEDEDEDMPANISNRLSKLYENGSIQMNQSQTSLYYSTKSTLSEAEAAEIASRRTSLAQDALGYSLGLSRGNSIRFSQYSLGSIHALQPFVGSSGAGSTPSSPGLARSMTDLMESRLTPRRPVSLFISSTTSATEDDNEDRRTWNENNLNRLQGSAVIESSAPAASPASSSMLHVTDTAAGQGQRASFSTASMRPATICVSPEDSNKIPIPASASISSSSTLTTLLTPSTSSTDQHEASAALALETSKRCFDEDVSFLKREEISEYLGTPKAFNRLVLNYYMDNFDFSGKRLDVAFRILCQKLVLKGETQEVDRVLEAFADRFVKCNPRTLLGGADQAKDVVHAITYSILLLNTDLHIVQQSSKMSRSAFVKNTLQVVQAQAEAQQQQLQDDSSLMASVDPTGLGLPRSTTGESGQGGLSPTGAPRKRTPSVKSWKSGHSQQTSGFGLGSLGHGSNSNSKMGLDPKANGGYGNGKYWHQELESLLKDIYAAVKQHQILLPVSPATLRTPDGRSRSNASLLSSPPTSPTSSGFGSSIFSSNRMSRLIYPSSSSSSASSISHLQHQQQDSAGGGGGAFGLGLSGRRNSVSQRAKQLRNEAIQRLSAQAQAQAQAQGAMDGSYLSISAPSSANSHATARYSIAGSILNETHVLDFASSREQNRGPVSSRDMTFMRTGGNHSQHSSSSRLSSMTMTTTYTSMSMTPSTATSTTLTTPSASQNSLASLQSLATAGVLASQEDPSLKKSQADQSGYHLFRHQLSTDIQELKEDLHQQHLGSRYRMEGILWRKHLLERSDKKAQHRAWRQLLVVLDQEQGTLSMFRSDGTLPQLLPPQQAHHQHGPQHQFVPSSLYSTPFGEALSYPGPSAVDNSSCITNDPGAPLFDEIPLQHTITNILPPPGYSSTRKHVFAVQLFTGAVYLFQTKTPQECEAWARTCNYWAARTSKEPLVGGIVNMEYGWGRALEMVSLSRPEDVYNDTPGASVIATGITDSPLPMNCNGSTSNISLNSTTHDYLNYPPSSSGSSSRPGYFGSESSRGRSASIRSGTRGSTSSASGGGGVNISSGGSSIPLGDRITLFDWTAPMPTMTRSLLIEEEQMLNLRRYVAGLEAEMETHQEHRLPMTRLFLPKSNNYAKAFNNWERRSQHLLKEMIKYQIYVECLEQSLVHFQQMLQDLGLDQQSLEKEQGRVEEQKEYEEEPHHHRDPMQTQERGHYSNDVEAELEQLVVHEGLASAII
ncbi:hypothetical protein BGX28_002098 [Mortierella sp. GBA30]|nr:hypothetical protein BGX28_002098 [Mortierella sp. GBA30]